MSSALPDAAFLKPAVDCLKALQNDMVTRHTHIFDDPMNVSIVSAMLSHTARFIENYVNSNHRMHNINIFIACKVKKHPISAKDPTFLLWNTITGATQNGQCSAHVHQTPQRDNETQNRTEAENSPTQPSHPSHPSQPSQPSQPSSGNFSQEDETYAIPVEVASKCLQLPLDGSGFSSHKNIFQKQSYCELGSKTLVEALQKVIDAEGTCRSKVQPCSSSSTRASKADDMIYLDLLPDYLRPKEGQGSVIMSVPEVTFSPKGAVSVSKTMKVPMNIRKPDRNKKNQNFAILCNLLHHTGHRRTCAEVLRAYAQEGFSSEGCRRRKKFSTSAASNCTGLQSCCKSKTQLCSFYISSDDKPVGRGTVHPFIKGFDGKDIPEGHIFARFGYVTNFEELTFPSNFTSQQRRDLHLIWKNGPTVWDKARIQRIELLGDYDKCIATAILVQDLIPHGAHESILKRVSRTSRTNSDTDVANAIVVCDVTLTELEMVESKRYPYMEWYNLPSLKMLRTLHLNNMEPPKVLNAEFLRKSNALLWNKNKYKHLHPRKYEPVSLGPTTSPL